MGAVLQIPSLIPGQFPVLNKSPRRFPVSQQLFDDRQELGRRREKKNGRIERPCSNSLTSHIKE